MISQCLFHMYILGQSLGFGDITADDWYTLWWLLPCGGMRNNEADMIIMHYFDQFVLEQQYSFCPFAKVARCPILFFTKWKLHSTTYFTLDLMYNSREMAHEMFCTFLLTAGKMGCGEVIWQRPVPLFCTSFSWCFISEKDNLEKWVFW
jgi:hypothetical protein